MSTSEIANGKPVSRIVVQYREKTSMVYELACGNAKLDLRITPRRDPERGDAWRIDAKVGRIDDAEMVTESAPTRREALLLVAKKWGDTQQETGRPAFDWEGVALALTNVRAL